MAKDKTKINTEKNKMAHSKLRAGGDVHIGDVYQTQNAYSTLAKFVAALFLFLFALFAVAVSGYGIEFFSSKKTTQEMPILNPKEAENISMEGDPEGSKATKKVKPPPSPADTEQAYFVRLEAGSTEPGFNDEALVFVRSRIKDPALTIVGGSHSGKVDGQLSVRAEAHQMEVKLGLRKAIQVRFSLDISASPQDGTLSKYTKSYSSKPYTVYRSNEIKEAFRQWLKTLG